MTGETTSSLRNGAHADGALSAAVARYLEAIFYIAGEGEPVRASRLANGLAVSQPTAGAMLRRMVADGLITIAPSKQIALTSKGEREAARIVRRHRITERWLTDMLGLDWLQADEEASKLEHALSDDVAERLYALIGQPETCPHGNPIPGAASTRGPERALSTLAPGQTSRVQRISEVAEHEVPDLLRFLGEHGFALGAEVTAIEVNRGGGTITARIGGRDVPLSLEVAGKVWIEA